MKTNVKTFSENVKAAKAVVNETICSPYYLVNMFNKLADGKLAGIDGLDVDTTSVKAVANVVKTLHTGRYRFDLQVFSRDSYGRICLPTTAKRCPRHGLDLIGVSPKGWQYMAPIRCTASALFAAFCKVARIDVQAAAKAEKAAAREAKAAAKAAKEFAKAKAAVTAVFGELASTFSPAEVAEKYAAIKSAK